MIVALTVVAASAAFVQPNASAASPESVFISACLDGSVRLSPEEAQAVDFGALPDALRSKLAKPAKSQVWKLRSAGNSYLYVLEYNERERSPYICGLASDQMQMASASDAVATRIGASRDRDPRSVALEWWMPDNGYMAVATRVREYTTLQMNKLTSRQRQEALDNQ